VVLIVGGLLLALVVLCVGAAALFWFNAQVVPPPVAATAVQSVPRGAPRVYDRAELRRLVLGSDPNAMNRTLGRPTWIELGPPEVWHYGAVTRDPATGQVDADVAFVFGVGTGARSVKDVRFTSADVNGKGNCKRTARPSATGPPRSPLMPRRQFEDDDRDEPRPRSRNNSTPLVLILALAGGFGSLRALAITSATLAAEVVVAVAGWSDSRSIPSRAELWADSGPPRPASS
jgi:hypothetical protein